MLTLQPQLFDELFDEPLCGEVGVGVLLLPLIFDGTLTQSLGTQDKVCHLDSNNSTHTPPTLSLHRFIKQIIRQIGVAVLLLGVL